MNKLNNIKVARYLAYLCSLAYMASYLTRINFAAVTIAIIKEYGWEKTAVSAVTTALFISYGIGQVISGWLGDHTRPNRLVAFGLISSSCMNLLIPLCSTIPQMTAVWAINGMAQAMMWPPIVRILAAGCHKKVYQNATVIVSWGSSSGTILVFLLASFTVGMFGDWRLLFRICASVAVITTLIWIAAFSRIEKYSNSPENINAGLQLAESAQASSCETPGKKEEKKIQKMPGGLILVLSFILITVIVIGALRDSITSWLPNYVSETFGLSSSAALLTSVILPILTAITYPLVLVYYRRFFKSELNCAATIFGFSALSALLLYFFSHVNPFVSVILLALISACMHGANFLIIGLIPKKFDRFGNVSMISGIINSFVYVGSSISIWGIAAVVQKSGWLATIVIWGVLALSGAGICFAVSRKFQSFFK
jgi:OPA family glycerol-3-phosphate transporter-like MFS transporter